MIWTVPILLGIGSAVGMGLAAFSRDHDARLFAIELAAMWALANLFWLYNALQYLPALDWILGVQALIIVSTRSAKWAKLFVMLIALRLTLHVVDYLTDQAFLVQYIHGLNATFAALLVVVSYDGGVHVSGRLLGYLHRLGARLRNPLRAAAARLIP